MREASATEATANTRSVVRSAPPNAAAGRAAATLGKRALARSTARPAPELMPSTFGLARGLLSTVCVMQPDTARAAPANTPASMRGKRTCSTILAAAGVDVCPPVKTASTSASETFVEPSMTAASAATRQSAAEMASATRPRRSDACARYEPAAAAGEQAGAGAPARSPAPAAGEGAGEAPAAR